MDFACMTRKRGVENAGRLRAYHRTIANYQTTIRQLTWQTMDRTRKYWRKSPILIPHAAACLNSPLAQQISFTRGSMLRGAGGDL